MIAILDQATKAIILICADQAAAEQAVKAHKFKRVFFAEVPQGGEFLKLIWDGDLAALVEDLSPHWVAFRAERFARLLASDPAMLSDHPLYGSAEVVAYRNALRTLPANTTDPRTPEWPQKPAGL